MSYLRLRLEEFQTRPKEIQQNLNQFIGENFATQMKCDLNPDLTKVQIVLFCISNIKCLVSINFKDIVVFQWYHTSLKYYGHALLF